MRARWMQIAVVLAVLAVLAGGGVAWATAGDDDGNATGPEADRARAAAVAHVGGGKVTGVERESEGSAVWEVEIRGPDGTTVEVALDAGYGVVSSGGEEEEGNEDETGEDEREEG